MLAFIVWPMASVLVQLPKHEGLVSRAGIFSEDTLSARAKAAESHMLRNRASQARYFLVMTDI